jgi:hypothetical protein
MKKQGNEDLSQLKGSKKRMSEERNEKIRKGRIKKRKK